MSIAPELLLNSRLKPLCPRDGHVMKYEAFGAIANSGDQASYHCGSGGCTVRYSPYDGYFTLMGLPGHTYALREPGVNTLGCPTHSRWLYRQENKDANPGVRWSCGVQGCGYDYDAKTKGHWVRT